MNTGEIDILLTPCRKVEEIKIGVPPLISRAIYIVTNKIINQKLSHSADFFKGIAVFWIIDRKIQKFQRPIESISAHFLIIFITPIYCPSDLGSDICHLFHRRKLLPSRHQIFMKYVHLFTSLVTVFMINSRIFLFSTPLEKLLRRGLTFIIESNSINSLGGSSG